jgi:prepilin-type N-terminal cleavage/methylation domain-containing protein
MNPSGIDTKLTSQQPRRAGFSLIELLLVVALMAIIAGVVLPRLGSHEIEQLESAAQIVASDFDYARNLAVVNNSAYKIRFDTRRNQYILEHSGTNSLLDNLPDSQFDEALDEPTKRVTDLEHLPHLGPAIRLSAIHKRVYYSDFYGSSDYGNDSYYVSDANATEVEFNSLGGTTAAEHTIVWLSSGSGKSQQHISVEISPITGLARVGQVRSAIPGSDYDYDMTVSTGFGEEF